jgi:hypothetical protein
VPAFIANADPRVAQRNRCQVALAIGVLAADQRVTQRRCAGAPLLASRDDWFAGAVVAQDHGGVGRFGAPDAPGGTRPRRAVQLGQDCQRVGVAFVQLEQAQVILGDLRQALPALQRGAAGRQRQLVLACSDQLCQLCTGGLAFLQLRQRVSQRMRRCVGKTVNFHAGFLRFGTSWAAAAGAVC